MHLPEGKGSSDVDTVNDGTMGGFPTVFISYNWGKQTLVCTHIDQLSLQKCSWSLSYCRNSSSGRAYVS